MSKPGRLVDRHLSDTEVRGTIINWEQQLQNIVDSYEQHRGTVHGVQKDAIQNAWDARLDKKGKGWKLVFELVSGKSHAFFTMTDQGTTGLTGKILMPEELDQDLPSEERWGRFENVAFTKQPSADFVPLGSRGRGKFIFVGASLERTILYDTLRPDGTYRFGWRTIKKTESPIAAYDGEKGKAKLLEMTDGVLKPLSTVGTRVIIVDPIPELVWALQSDKFLRHVGETWWEIIQKLDIPIIIRVGGKDRTATLPNEFQLPIEDSDAYKVWRKLNQRIPHPDLKIRIRSLHIVSKKGETVPEEIRGVAIQRGGMKVCAIEPRYLPKDLTDSIYGYVTLDEETERLLLPLENPEHYGYNFREAVPRSIRHFVEEELHRFAAEKLGHVTDLRARRREEQKAAERKALIAINRIAKTLGITAFGPGVSGRGGGSSEAKDVRILFPEPVFPRAGDRRVNYGEKLTEIKVKIINDSGKPTMVRLRLFVRYFEEKILHLYEGDINVPEHSCSGFAGPYELQLDAAAFPQKGKYSIVARIVSLTKETKGRKLDDKQKVFYLEEEPPSKGLFEDVVPIEYPDKAKELLGEAIPGEGGGHVFQYNVAHPEYKAVEGNVEWQAAYLFRLMAFELCRIDLASPSAKLFTESEVEEPDAVLRRTLQLVGKFTYKYRMES